MLAHFQIKKKAIYGENRIQTKTKKHLTARFKNLSTENLKCKSVSYQTVARESNTNSIQFAKRNHNNDQSLHVCAVVA